MTGRRLYIAAAVAAVAAGVVAALARAWVCDDAFISFRYADQLVHGHGMVFNPGERVEGETNLLWTLWSAVGLALGAGAVAWAKTWSIACFAAALGLLARLGWPIAHKARWPLPAAAMFGAACVAWIDFATSGLETSAFTFALVGGYALACPRDGQPSRPLHAGVVLGLASLLRPDAVVVGVVVGAWLAAGGAHARGRASIAAAARFAAGFAAIWIPALVWRVSYYGEWVPNTYYAKSADRAWWSQGFWYLYTFAQRYWPLLLAFPLAVTARRRAAVVLELAIAAAYALYVARVGGDFMFARFLVPVIPFLALALARGLDGMLAGRRAFAQPAAIVAVTAALAAMPQTVDGVPPGIHGIMDERTFYGETYYPWAERAEHAGPILRRALDGLPVIAAFTGTEARVVYESRVATAIECETGLTDRTIARQPLAERGRVGHEKHAQLEYILERGVELVFAQRARALFDFDTKLPYLEVDFDDVRAWVVVWNPALMAALRARGARFIDLPTAIDLVTLFLPLIPDDVVLDMWARLRRSYFDHVADPRREAAFRERLAR